MGCAASALAANNVRGWRDTARPLTDSPHCSAALPPGAVSNKINYQVAAQRTGRSFGARLSVPVASRRRSGLNQSASQTRADQLFIAQVHFCRAHPAR